MQHPAWRISGGGGIVAHIAFKNEIYHGDSGGWSNDYGDSTKYVPFAIFGETKWLLKLSIFFFPNSHLFPIRTLRSYIYNTTFLLQYNVFFPRYSLFSSISWHHQLQGYKYKLPGCRQLYCLPIGMNIILIAHFFFRKDFKSSEDYLLNCTM